MSNWSQWFLLSPTSKTWFVSFPSHHHTITCLVENNVIQLLVVQRDQNMATHTIFHICEPNSLSTSEECCQKWSSHEWVTPFAHAIHNITCEEKMTTRLLDAADLMEKETRGFNYSLIHKNIKNNSLIYKNGERLR